MFPEVSRLTLPGLIPGPEAAADPLNGPGDPGGGLSIVSRLPLGTCLHWV